MTRGVATMQRSLAQALEDLHARIAGTVLHLDESVLHWRPVPGIESIYDLIVKAAEQEEHWIAETVANVPAGERIHEVQAGLSPGTHPLFRLGSMGQFSQLILANMTAADWVAERQVDGDSLRVADCVLYALEDLSRVLGQIEMLVRFWDARDVGR